MPEQGESGASSEAADFLAAPVAGRGAGASRRTACHAARVSANRHVGRARERSRAARGGRPASGPGRPAADGSARRRGFGQLRGAAGAADAGAGRLRARTDGPAGRPHDSPIHRFPSRADSRNIRYGQPSAEVDRRRARSSLLVIARGHAQAPQPQPQTAAVGEPARRQGSNRPRSRRRSQQPPTFRAGINFVRVDVIISDKNGNPVGDLQAADFDVSEDGKPQKIDTFKLIKLDGGTADAIKEPPKQIRTDYDEEAEAARDDVRLFAIFLDDYHVRRGTSMAVRGQLAQVHRDAARAVGHDRRDVSARVDRVGPHDAQPFGGRRAACSSSSAASTNTSRRTSSKSTTRTIRPKRSSASATRCRCRRSRR